jgi:UTP-glucose-1-phosphate uridylyltransferase
MNKEILVLPVGGSASRMLGLPKFMLPVSESETLIERHCRGAVSAGYDELHIITRQKYFNLIESYFSDRKIDAHIHSLPHETETMSETLKIGSGLIKDIVKSSVTIGLSDTAFYGASYENIYRKLIEDSADYSLGLFSIREDQFGKLGQVDTDSKGKVLSMQDKNLSCIFPAIWGLAKVPGSMLVNLNISEAHIGIGIEKLVAKGEHVSGVMNQAEYYDCGTFSEYSKFIQRLQS